MSSGAWTTTCTSVLTSDGSCATAPVLATDALDTSTLIGGTAYTQAAAGYTTQGFSYADITVNISTVDGGGFTSETTTLYAADSVLQDYWLSNVDAQAG